MKTLTDAANRLRDLADDLCQLGSGLTEPVQEGLDIRQAAAKLRSVLGDQYFSIEMTIDFHTFSKPCISWKLWDGKKQHGACTLAAALNSVLASHVPEPVNPILAAEEALCRLHYDSPSQPSFSGGWLHLTLFGDIP